MDSLHRPALRKSMGVIASGALTLVFAATAVAAPPLAKPAIIALPALKAPPPKPPPAAPVWIVDKAASRVGFQATLGGQTVDGVFKSWDAQIAFDPKNLKASHALITVETASAMTGQPTRDALLPTPPWLNIRKFPKAVLVSRSIAQTSPGHYSAAADLKLKGVTRRMSIPFTLSLGPTAGHMIGSMMLDRTAFGIGQPPGMSLTSLSPMVKVTLRLTAKRDH
ncbi:MAG: YceI family protein [Caulobacteraceae bacterium]